eukprot:COSAG02_NODE_1838_length_10711_cov_222.198643_4_plen_71_part_00
MNKCDTNDTVARPLLTASSVQHESQNQQFDLISASQFPPRTGFDAALTNRVDHANLRIAKFRAPLRSMIT